MSKTSPGLPFFRGRHRTTVRARRGFVLVVTLSLLVLLMVIAVGLLSLSAVSLRSAAGASARQEAMGNARLALLMAIGDLQIAAGPDQRITAPADMVDPGAPRGITGVWKGWQFSADDLSVNKQDRSQFVQWLVSHGSREALQNPGNVPSQGSNSARLIDEGSLPSPAQPDERIAAQIVAIGEHSGQNSGGYAFAVLDEAVKARADLAPKDLELGEIEAQARIGEAQRYGIEAIDKLEESGFEWWLRSGQERMITLPTGQLLSGEPPVDEFTHDLTTWSRGLLTNSASGGLRSDLSAMFEDIPSDISGTRVYQDSAVSNAPANPYWSHLADYHNIYRKLTSGDGGYKATASIPSGHRPYNTRTITATPAAFRYGYPLMPAITKLQMAFSIVARNAHGGWPGQIQNATGDPQKKYMLHMIYSPIVTVHNPYNTPLEFTSLQMRFADIPIGFQFYVNNRPQLTAAAPLNQLYVRFDSDSNTTKEFFLKLVPQLGTSSSGRGSRGGAITLQPGECKVFGTSVDPDWSWAKDRPGDGNTMFDWRSDKTSQSNPFELAPGWNTAGVGFDIDWLVPRPLKSSSAAMNGVLPLSSRDRVDVAFEPLPPLSANNRFTATIEIETRGGRFSPAGIIEFDYEEVQTLEEFLSDRHQQDIEFPVRLERSTSTSMIYEADATMIKDYARVLPFAIFSFYNKTTLEAGTAARPGVSHPPTNLVTRIQAEFEDPAIHPYEATLLPVRNAGGGNAGAIEIDPEDRGYAFTGHSLGTGSRTAALHEIPALPLQSLAQLRHANLSASGHLPAFTYTVGESWAHPLIPAGAVHQPQTEQGYPFIDHTWLANTRLWDSSFFSTICPWDGPMFPGSSSATSSQILSEFLSGNRKLLNSRLSPRIPPGTTPGELAAELGDDNELYSRTAAHLWVEGPFNVNSTSVAAWKTLLTSLHKTSVPFYDAMTSPGASQSTAADDELISLPRQRRPAGPAIEDNSSREERWRGFHTLTEDEIAELATEIVAEVRERGPFLSLAEFVNRNPVGGKEGAALKGALQAAIDRTRINQMFTADSRDIMLTEASGDEFPYPEAITGENAVGAPGYLTQGDVLSAFGCTPTVRGDSFRIRAYGESVNQGKVVARAWCEAVVQRNHDFVDPTDRPETPIAQLQREANKTFGRRFELVSFRWLSPEEI